MRACCRRWIPAVAALIVLGVALGPGGPVLAAPPGSPWGAAYFPNVPLITHEGKTVKFYDDLLKDKKVVINLIYTSCTDVCPLETARLVQVQRLLGDRVGKDVSFYSISIDPKRDTPAVLNAYMAKFHVGPGWLFLTGEQADIKLLSKRLGLWSATDAENPDGHLASLMLGDESAGQWMRHSAVDNPRFLATAITNFFTLDAPGAAGRSYAEAVPLPMPAEGRALFAGQHLFQTRCAACHSLGRGDAIGPDLLGVTDRRDRPWLARIIQEPDRVLAERDPLALALFERFKQVKMPNLGLGDGDVEAVLAYLEARSTRRQGTAQKAALSPLLEGDRPSSHAHHHHAVEEME
jgi:protein SCO1